jgi:hypothetical protein
MAPDTFEQQLDRAASAHGIDPGFWDIWGNYHHASKETKQAILRAMGVPAETPEELAQSAAEQGRREWERLLPPCIVAGDSEYLEAPLHVPAEHVGERARLTVRQEDGVVGNANSTFARCRMPVPPKWTAARGYAKRRAPRCVFRWDITN